MAGEHGFEPRLPESKSGVLPLDDSPMNWSEWQDSNLRHPAPKAGGMNQTILHSEILCQGAQLLSVV